MINYKYVFFRLYLVAEGQCAYTGSCANALGFFKSINYPCPTNFNPADHYIFTLAIVPGEEEECRRRVDVSSSQACPPLPYAAVADRDSPPESDVGVHFLKLNVHAISSSRPPHLNIVLILSLKKEIEMLSH